MEEIVAILAAGGLLYSSYIIVKKMAAPTASGVKVIRTKDIGCMFTLLVGALAVILILLGG